MGQLLFRVADVFTIWGRGVAVVGNICKSEVAFRLRIGDLIELVRADGMRLRTEVRGIEMIAVPVGKVPDLYTILLGPGVERADVAAGDQVWRVEAAGT